MIALLFSFLIELLLMLVVLILVVLLGFVVFIEFGWWVSCLCLVGLGLFALFCDFGLGLFDLFGFGFGICLIVLLVN